MPTPTPNPTAERVLDVYLPLVGEGLGEAQQELLDRLKATLPAVITAYNSRHSLAGRQAIEQPAGYGAAPSVLDDEYINKVLVGVSVENAPQGIGGAFRGEVEVVIYIIDRRIKSGVQVASNWKRAELVRACLRAFIQGSVNQQGRECWRSLVPSGYSLLPGDWSENYSGVAAKFRMVIAPTTG